MTTIVWVLIAALVVTFICMIVCARAANHWHGRARIFKKYWEEQVDSQRETADMLSDLQWKYGSLKRDYDDLAELDEGEDYVRESLGYPPDEDDQPTRTKEST